jgi:hypothetical protein
MRISFKKYPFGTAPPDPRLESGAGAVPNGPLILKEVYHQRLSILPLNLFLLQKLPPHM